MDPSTPPPEKDTSRLASPQPALVVSAVQPTASSRKRKRAPATPPSPAPSDNGNSSNSTAPSELISIHSDLYSRPQLSISRGPIFVPTAEGSPYFKTDLVAFNRLGFRYVPAGINPPGHVLPCRTIESNPVAYRVSWEDRSPFITVTKDGLGLRGDSGFRSSRCNAPITEGRWYMEVKILRGGGEHVDGRREGSHVRLGWARREAPLNAPVGLDGYSYGYRDKTGDKVTLSRPRPYGRPYGTGDVVGLYISLPPRRVANSADAADPAHIKRERIPIDLKGQEVFEILEYTPSKEMISLMDFSAKANSSSSVPSAPLKKSGAAKLSERTGPSAALKASTAQLRPLPTFPGSRIAFFVNGECQGTAFHDIYSYLQLRQSETSRKGKEKKRVREGVKEHRENPFDDGTLGYYPFISLFNEACVQLNPGPDFAFPPPPDIDALLDGTESAGTERMWRPTCERYPEFMAAQWELDAAEEREARVEATKAAAAERAEAAKKAERNKKRQQTEARKRAKLAAVEQQRRMTQATDDTLAQLAGPGQPSPLRHGTHYDDVEEFPDFIHSPAPTFASNGELQGGQSGYNSDNIELDPETLENIPTPPDLDVPSAS